MTWRDEITKPSLGDVEFNNVSVTSTIGRRTVTYVYPFRDNAKGKDLGARPDRFVIDGNFVGDFYNIDLQALRDVLKSEGPYEFAHPYWGRFWCQLDGAVSIVESTAKRGGATFSIPLVDVSTADFPQVFDDPGPALLNAYNLAVSALSADLDAGLNYVPLGVTPEEAKKNRPGFLQSLTNALNNIGQALGGVNGKVAGKLNKLNDLSNAIDGVTSQATTLLDTPGALASALQGVLNSTQGLVKAFVKDKDPSTSQGMPPTAAGDASIEAMNGADIDLGADDVDQTTPSQEQEAVALQAMSTFLKGAAAAEAAAAAVDVTMGTASHALKFADTVGANLIAGAEDENASDDTYHHMGDLEAALRVYMEQESAKLPEQRLFEVEEPTHSILLAYILFDDAERDAEINSQNVIKNPIFCGEDGPILVVEDG